MSASEHPMHDKPRFAGAGWTKPEIFQSPWGFTFPHFCDYRPNMGKVASNCITAGIELEGTSLTLSSTWGNTPETNHGRRFHFLNFLHFGLNMEEVGNLQSCRV